MEINRLGLCSKKKKSDIAVWVFFQLLIYSSFKGFECLIGDYGV